MTADALTDVAGVRVGHATRAGDGWLTGTTVVLAPAAASMDVFRDYAHRGNAFADAVQALG